MIRLHCTHRPGQLLFVRSIRLQEMLIYCSPVHTALQPSGRRQAYSKTDALMGVCCVESLLFALSATRNRLKVTEPTGLNIVHRERSPGLDQAGLVIPTHSGIPETNLGANRQYLWIVPGLQKRLKWHRLNIFCLCPSLQSPLCTDPGAGGLHCGFPVVFFQMVTVASG
jgi:hypothetical protein